MGGQPKENLKKPTDLPQIDRVEVNRNPPAARAEAARQEPAPRIRVQEQQQQYNNQRRRVENLKKPTDLPQIDRVEVNRNPPAARAEAARQEPAPRIRVQEQQQQYNNQRRRVGGYFSDYEVLEVISDIKAAFHNIAIQPEHRKVQVNRNPQAARVEAARNEPVARDFVQQQQQRINNQQNKASTIEPKSPTPISFIYFSLGAESNSCSRMKRISIMEKFYI
ncbi:hypothetical protein DERP_014319 [Dermatophagoides pteronyssinus]|uniref:Uncharacterized protein n=1 Tax=Dermatophagoides pteronyssinus TaxID=6956 RepID=A0ABQ8JXA8_DERPT|nr:hypothetical protein DERP_014319 [Dermatophagoides pteronyssinus]